MLTKVYLEGPLGQKFGREWELDVNTPTEALQIIEANVPGVTAWIKRNANIYANYKVICKDAQGRNTHLSDDTYGMQVKAKSIRFVPLTAGAGAGARVIVGAFMVVGGLVFQQPWLTMMGASMMLGGIIELLSPQPQKNKSDDSARSDGTSYYFNGPVNTETQGIPVPLIYGRCLVGSQAISANISVDQIM